MLQKKQLPGVAGLGPKPWVSDVGRASSEQFLGPDHAADPSGPARRAA
jgi:hypothetical protein